MGMYSSRAEEGAKIISIILAYIYLTSYAYLTGYTQNYHANGFFIVEFADIIAVALSGAYYKAVTACAFIALAGILLIKRKFLLFFLMLGFVAIFNYLDWYRLSPEMASCMIVSAAPTFKGMLNHSNYLMYALLGNVSFSIAVMYSEYAKKHIYITALVCMCPVFVAFGILNSDFDNYKFVSLYTKDKKVTLMRKPLLLEKGLLAVDKDNNATFIFKEDIHKISTGNTCFSHNLNECFKGRYF